MKRFKDAYLVARAARPLLDMVLEYVEADQRKKVLTPEERARLARAQEVLDLADRGPQQKPTIKAMSALARRIERHERRYA